MAKAKGDNSMPGKARHSETCLAMGRSSLDDMVKAKLLEPECPFSVKLSDTDTAGRHPWPQSNLACVSGEEVRRETDARPEARTWGKAAYSGHKDTKRAPKPSMSTAHGTRDSLKGESLMGTEAP